MIEYAHLKQLLSGCGQEHLLQFWPSLSESGRRQLATQIMAIDWVAMSQWIKDYVLHDQVISLPVDLQPAPSLPAAPRDQEQVKLYAAAERRGRELLSSGRVAGFTVAGGQGTRLGYDGPKGTMAISPVQGKSFFQWFAEGIIRAGEKYRVAIPWYIMTSPLNDQQTRDFFQAHDFFGLSAANVMFFPQGVLPAIGLDGRVLLAAPDSLALSPNGHGGSLLALHESGALADMARRGIDYISYWQVDNPLVYMFDPLFIGLHDRTGSEMSCRGLVKTGPMEKIGNFGVTDDRVIVVEYSDMPAELARAGSGQGDLLYRVGSPAIHVLNRSFVERLTRGGSLGLPFHRAVKKVACVSDDGDKVVPEQPNAVKLETFIFDALPLAANVLILEVDREEQFGPVKSWTGEDSVESCHCLLLRRAARWLEQAGIEVPRRKNGEPDCMIELSPRSFLDSQDVRDQRSCIRPPQPGAKEYYP